MKHFAPGFQRLDVRLTVGHYFLVQIEYAMLHGLVPLVKVLSHVQFHSIRVVVAHLGPRPHLLLMGLLRVEEMRKETFLAFRQIEGGGELGEGERKETQTVLERQPSRLQAQEFRPHANLIFDLHAMVVELLKDEHPIVAFEVVKNSNDFPRYPQHFRFDQQPIAKLLSAYPPVKHQSRQGVAMVLPFSANEDGDVPLFILRGFVIRVHGIGWQSGSSLLFLFVRGLVFVGGQETNGVGGATLGPTTWAFGRGWPFFLRVWILPVACTTYEC